MVKIKKVGVWSFAKLQAIIMAIVGLILGILVALFSAILSSIAPMSGYNLGWLSIIVFPICYGLIGIVAGAIGAVLYNLVAKWVGGLEIEFDQ